MVVQSSGNFENRQRATESTLFFSFLFLESSRFSPFSCFRGENLNQQEVAAYPVMQVGWIGDCGDACWLPLASSDGVEGGDGTEKNGDEKKKRPCVATRGPARATNFN